ncbi:ABC transporter permease [Limnobacter litoralis]|uniref:Transport permease protein n=1 Tax=Limnobacter litoralis TaxID=481366 RepID=A0ABQ5YQP8_9BURK|nr:ABC transporter permease [Limnobacter litoralis]GLR25586.1 transport permease protein [Limnobacter litoralis]
MTNWFAVYRVWARNSLVWRKLAVPSLLGNVIDPVMALLAFGLGLGSMLPRVGGLPYLHYLAVGALGVSAMNAATFEALYSAFSRMHVQKTWNGIMNTPVRLHEVVLGEWAWAATKSAISTGLMLLVVAVLGVGTPSFWLMAWPFLIVAGAMFSALALCVNAKAPGYDFFMFYFTLVVTPMTFLSGAFFPRDRLPDWLHAVAEVLPLSFVVDALRAVYQGQWLYGVSMLFWVFAYMVAGLALAVYLTRKRFVKLG